MKEPIPNTAEDALLVLVNDRDACNRLLAAVRRYKSTRYYAGLRVAVYATCRHLFHNYSSNNQTITSQLCWLVLCRYWEEVTNDPWSSPSFDDFFRNNPDWAQKHVECYRPSEQRLQLAINSFLNSEVQNHLSNALHYGNSLKPFTQGKSTMNTSKSLLAVETRTFVYGEDVNNLSDNEIVDHIRHLEKQIKAYNEIENKPRMLLAKIEQLHADIKALVDVADKRTPTTEPVPAA